MEDSFLRMNDLDDDSVFDEEENEHILSISFLLVTIPRRIDI